MTPATLYQHLVRRYAPEISLCTCVLCQMMKFPSTLSIIYIIVKLPLVHMWSKLCWSAYNLTCLHIDSFITSARQPTICGPMIISCAKYQPAIVFWYSTLVLCIDQYTDLYLKSSERTPRRMRNLMVAAFSGLCYVLLNVGVQVDRGVKSPPDISMDVSRIQSVLGIQLMRFEDAVAGFM